MCAAPGISERRAKIVVGGEGQQREPEEGAMSRFEPW